MDIIPALDFYENTNAEIAQDYFYFLPFLTQNHPDSRTVDFADPEAFLKHTAMDYPTQPAFIITMALEA